jgi:predicted phosphoadenosine phosphosulfate sulfurtransferase
MGTKNNIRKYVVGWLDKGYPTGIPDEAPVELEKRGLVPSYRNICLALMKNPNNLESLGIKRKKCELYSSIKRSELGIKQKQFKLKL